MAAWWAVTILACTSAGARAHRTDTDLGTEKVKSNPATARRVGRVASADSIAAMAAARCSRSSPASSRATRAATRSARDRYWG